MSLVFVGGGARSGKSSFAQNLALDYARKNKQLNQLHFIATAKAIDEEMVNRIQKHQLDRSQYFQLHESPLEVVDTLAKIPKLEIVLLDCVSMLISNYLVSGIVFNSEILVTELTSRSGLTVVVANEVGNGVVPEYELGRVFRDLNGQVNQLIVARADEVYILNFGIATKLK